MGKTRLDVLLFERGLAESREKAKTTIMSGVVFVNGRRFDKPGMSVSDDSEIELRGQPLGFVSRGGLKLEKAIEYFDVSPDGKMCIDCGASTGGFTDCLLKNGAKHVYAIDVGYGQLAWSLRTDPRVTNLERMNIRYVTTEQIPERQDLAVIDVSFISLQLVLPVVRNLLKPEGEVLCLIKPQFEAGRERVGKKGVVREESTHIEVLEKFIAYAEEAGFSVKGITFSPIKGPEGNIEFLACLGPSGFFPEAIDTDNIVKMAHREL